MSHRYKFGVFYVTKKVQRKCVTVDIVWSFLWLFPYYSFSKTKTNQVLMQQLMEESSTSCFIIVVVMVMKCNKTSNRRKDVMH